MNKVHDDSKFIRRMKQVRIQHGNILCTEEAHIEADNILVEFLRENGYTELADTYENIPKWYA